jgi:hypothetical protein
MTELDSLGRIPASRPALRAKCRESIRTSTHPLHRQTDRQNFSSRQIQSESPLALGDGTPTPSCGGIRIVRTHHVGMAFALREGTLWR